MRGLLLAGEESGVLYANQIRAEILRRWPEAEIRGYGDYGFRVDDLAVMGIGQVLKKIFYFLRVKKTMERAIGEWKPDVVCTVDYPGMNLKLAASVRFMWFVLRSGRGSRDASRRSRWRWIGSAASSRLSPDCFDQVLQRLSGIRLWMRWHERNQTQRHGGTEMLVRGCLRFCRGRGWARSKSTCQFFLRS